MWKTSVGAIEKWVHFPFEADPETPLKLYLPFKSRTSHQKIRKNKS
jgi:hypothetical protein